MKRTVLAILMVLLSLTVVSCGLTTKEAPLAEFQRLADAFLLDFATHPTWDYYVETHVYETGHPEDVGGWFTDSLSIDFAEPYAYRQVDTNRDDDFPVTFDTYLHETYEAVNGCLARRRPFGLDVSLDRFEATEATAATLAAALPAHPVELFALFARDGIEKVEQDHFRIVLPVTEFLDFDEFIAFFSWFKVGLVRENIEDDFRVDVWFGPEVTQIVALANDTDEFAAKTYDYNNWIYIHKIDEAERYTNSVVRDYTMLPDDYRLVASAQPFPVSQKVRLLEDVPAVLRVDLEPGTYRATFERISGFTTVTVTLLEADGTELWGNNLTVTEAATYYVRYVAPYDPTTIYVVVESVPD